MNGPRARVVAILFLVILLLLLLLIPREGLDPDAAFQMCFHWALRVIGGGLAVVAAVELCFLAIAGRTEQAPVVIALLLSGLALAEPSWEVVIGLAALAMTLAVVPRLSLAAPAAGSENKPAPARRKATTRKASKKK